MSEDPTPQEILGLNNREYIILGFVLLAGAPVLVITAPIIAAALLFPFALWVMLKAIGGI